jgi:hypothetical protein
VITEIKETVLLDWVCQTCKTVTPGGQPDPYPCCTRPFVIRIRSAQAVPVNTEENR